MLYDVLVNYQRMLLNPLGVSWEIRTQKDLVASFWYPLVAFGDAWRLCSGGVSETSFRKDTLLNRIDRYRASIVCVEYQREIIEKALRKGVNVVASLKELV